MTLPDFHDNRPYTHPNHPGTWKLSVIGPTTITLRNTNGDTTDELIADWPGNWQAHETWRPQTTASFNRPVDYTHLTDGIHEITGARAYSVTSTDNQRIYTVIVTPSGHATCTCPARVPNCRHVKRVLAARAGF